MINKHKLLAMAVLMIGLLLPSQLLAAWTAVTRADLNLRVGPDTIYGVIDIIPAGEPVEVIGCIAGHEWCDVEWLGLRGFVSADYLVQPGTSVYLPQYAPSVGVPIISFSFGTYHDRHYRDRSWYRERHWGGRWHDKRHRYDKPRRKRWVEEPRRKKYRVEEPRYLPERRSRRAYRRSRQEEPKIRHHLEQDFFGR